MIKKIYNRLFGIFRKKDDVSSLMQELQKLHKQRRQEIMEKYQRSLPLADELVDRWDRANFLGFGKGASVYDSALVIGSVQVGENTWVGPSCILDGSGGLKIGSFCSIAAGCHIYSHDTVDWALSGGVCEYQRKPTQIGDCCYLGPHSVITSGVSIGNHCLVGAFSLVKNDVPDHTFVAGIPAKPLGKIEVNGKEVKIIRF